MPRLHQIIPVLKEVKSRAYAEISELHHLNQKHDLFNGFSKTYRKKDENGEDLPSEQKKVTSTVSESFDRLRKVQTELLDLTLTQDSANCLAKADVVIDGHPLLSDIPATTLIFLEKQIVDVRTFVDKLPILDDAEDWIPETSSGLYKTLPTSVHRTKKIQKPIVLYNATPQHPAQTQLISEDEVVGYWDTIKRSGGITKLEKQKILDKVETLLRAIKFAREQANLADAPLREIGKTIFSYLLD